MHNINAKKICVCVYYIYFMKWVWNCCLLYCCWLKFSIISFAASTPKWQSWILAAEIVHTQSQKYVLSAHYRQNLLTSALGQLLSISPLQAHHLIECLSGTHFQIFAMTLKILIVVMKLSIKLLGFDLCFWSVIIQRIERIISIYQFARKFFLR